MPKQRVQHGRVMVREEPPTTSNSDIPSAILTYEYDPTRTLKPGSTLHEEPSIDIGWNREYGYVQMHFVAPREYWDGWIGAYENSPEQTHMATYSENLSRKQINEMIKVLRRARDAAYGADE